MMACKHNRQLVSDFRPPKCFTVLFQVQDKALASGWISRAFDVFGSDLGLLCPRLEIRNSRRTLRGLQPRLLFAMGPIYT